MTASPTLLFPDVAFDADDVVIDFVGGICETLSRDYGVDVNPESITSWNFGQFIDHIIGEDWWTWMEKHAWLWHEKFKPIPGAIGSLETLRREGWRLELITAKPAWAEVAVWAWLGRYARVPTFQTVTIVPQPNVTGQKKHDVSSATILVDDRPENCHEWQESREDRLAILFDRPHNHHDHELVRAKDWRHVVELLRHEAALRQEGS
jgi:5'(3')-deoxyribonucleotidase